MYAIFENGSRQHRVSVGDRVRIDYTDAPINSTIELNKVLLVSDGSTLEIGKPDVLGARVIATITDKPGTKQTIQHYRRRKASKRLKGHTQPQLELRIEHILLAGQAIPEKAIAPVVAETPVAETLITEVAGSPETPALVEATAAVEAPVAVDAPAVN